MPLKQISDAHNFLLAALKPLIDGDGLVAVKVYYAATTDGTTHDVGVIALGGDEWVREKLSEVIREVEREDGAIRPQMFPWVLAGVPRGDA